jgi:hypothetical protein
VDGGGQNVGKILIMLFMDVPLFLIAGRPSSPAVNSSTSPGVAGTETDAFPMHENFTKGIDISQVCFTNNN